MSSEIKEIETASQVNSMDSHTYDSPTPSYNIEDYSIATENVDLSAGDIVLTDQEIAVKESAYNAEAMVLYDDLLKQEYNKELAENYEMFCRTGQNTSGLSFEEWKTNQIPFDYWKNVQTAIPSFNDWKPSFQTAYAASNNGAKVYRSPTSASGGVSPVAGGSGRSSQSTGNPSKGSLWNKASDDAFLDNSRSEFARMGIDSNALKCTPEEYAAGITPKAKYDAAISALNSSASSTPNVSGNYSPGGTRKNHITQADVLKAEQLANKWGIEGGAQALFNLWNAESGVNPSKVNNYGYSGIMQWGADACKEMGISKSQIPYMSLSQQIDLADKWIAKLNSYGSLPRGSDGKISTATLYAANFLPGRSRREVLTTRGEGYYRANSGLDFNRDGSITKSELMAYLNKNKVDLSSFNV